MKSFRKKKARPLVISGRGFGLKTGLEGRGRVVAGRARETTVGPTAHSPRTATGRGLGGGGLYHARCRRQGRALDRETESLRPDESHCDAVAKPLVLPTLRRPVVVVHWTMVGQLRKSPVVVSDPAIQQRL